jgi:hypothetical protein
LDNSGLLHLVRLGDSVPCSDHIWRDSEVWSFTSMYEETYM